MTRFAIDAPTALRILLEDVDVRAHQLVGAGALRSQVMQLLYAAVRAGDLSDAEAHARLEALASLGLRLLADRVSRAVAWKLAARLDWDDVARAEPLAVASLQADVLVTDDPTLAAAADGVVERMAWAEFVRALA